MPKAKAVLDLFKVCAANLAATEAAVLASRKAGVVMRLVE